MAASPQPKRRPGIRLDLPTDILVGGALHSTSPGLVTTLAGGSTSITATFTDDFTSGTACVCFTQPRTRSGSGTCNVARLTCGTTAGQQGGVTRGSTVTCQINNLPSGATTSNWNFTDGTNTVTPSTNPGTSWAGTAVIGGTVSVTATAAGGAHSAAPRSRSASPPPAAATPPSLVIAPPSNRPVT